jgi:hypothetical protein
VNKPWRSLLALVVLVPVLGMASEAGAERPGLARFKAPMTGEEEVPTGDLDGTGMAEIEIDVEAATVCYSVQYDRAGAPNRGHIHLGGPGTAGGIEVTLFELAASPADPRHDEIELGKLSECVSADPAKLAQIVANPGGYYVNLHNARFPAGVLRCQLDA